MNIIPKYAEFFKQCRRNRDKVMLLQGGRRTGKTTFTFQVLSYVGQKVGGVKILVVCGSFPQLQATMEDFINTLGVPIHGNVVRGYSAFTEGCMWQFRNYDTKEKAQGTQCDILFVNEAVNVEEEVYNTLVSGVRWFTILNYNPTKKCYVQRLIKDDKSNLLTTTCNDNPYLTPEQRETFEDIKRRAMSPTASNFDRYMYRVYYLGEFDSVAGRVFQTLGRMSHEEYKQIPAHEALGIDFGFATDGDPTTLIGVKVYDKHIYAHQYIYEKGLANNDELIRKVRENGFDEYTAISGDYGGMGATRIREINLTGLLTIHNAIKGKGIIDGIGAMLSLEGITLTDESVEMRNEMECYEMDENNRPHGEDHAIDAARYAFNYSRRMFS